MNAQEVIDIMKIAIAEVEWNYPLDYAIAFEEAIKALEKQIPKKLILGDDEQDYVRCPECKSEIAAMDDCLLYHFGSKQRHKARNSYNGRGWSGNIQIRRKNRCGK